MAKGEWFFEKALIDNIEQMQRDIKQVKDSQAGIQSQINSILQQVSKIQADVDSLVHSTQQRIDELTAQVLENTRKMGTVVDEPKFP